jgi:hypothetical protein
VDLFVAREHRAVLLFRSFIGMVCLCLTFYAMAKMVLTDASVIFLTSPAFTFILVRNSSPLYCLLLAIY